MGIIGTGIETSLLQTTQAQQQASKARDRQRNADADAARRYRDRVDLRVGEVQTSEAVRDVPEEDSEEAAYDERTAATPHEDKDEDEDGGRPRINLTA